MDVLTTREVLGILGANPSAVFSLQPVKIIINNDPGNVIRGYHIYLGQLPKMIHVKGGEIWTYVPKPDSTTS